jgi:hypothetical protein
VARVPLYREASTGLVVAKLKAGANVTLTDAEVGGVLEVTVAASGGGGGGAPTTASYVTLGTDATLTSERVLTAGSNITITDGGAGSTVTIAATVPTVPSAAGSVVAETSFGQSSVIGTSTSYARADHTHGTPAVPAHTALGSLAWTSAGHTGSSTAVAAWNGGGTATVVQATADETMLVRRSGVLQWVPVMLGLAFFGVETVDDGTILYLNNTVMYTGSIV